MTRHKLSSKRPTRMLTFILEKRTNDAASIGVRFLLLLYWHELFHSVYRNQRYSIRHVSPIALNIRLCLWQSSQVWRLFANYNICRMCEHLNFHHGNRICLLECILPHKRTTNRENRQTESEIYSESDVRECRVKGRTVRVIWFIKNHSIYPLNMEANLRFLTFSFIRKLIVVVMGECIM